MQNNIETVSQTKEAIGLRVSQALGDLLDRGVSYASIAKQVGVALSSIRNWHLRLRDPTIDNIEAISKITGISVVWFLTGIDKDGTAPNMGNTISIPVFSAKASAGFGIENFDADQIIKQMVFNEDWFRANVSFSTTDKLSLITATGDSMSPTIEDGDYLLVDHAIDYFKSDAIYVAVVDSELYVKRFQKVPGGSFLMLSDNPKYVPITIKESDDLRFIGRVIRHWRSEKI